MPRISPSLLLFAAAALLLLAAAASAQDCPPGCATCAPPASGRRLMGRGGHGGHPGRDHGFNHTDGPPGNHTEGPDGPDDDSDHQFNHTAGPGDNRTEGHWDGFNHTEGPEDNHTDGHWDGFNHTEGNHTEGNHTHYVCLTCINDVAYDLTDGKCGELDWTLFALHACNARESWAPVLMVVGVAIAAAADDDDVWCLAAAALAGKTAVLPLNLTSLQAGSLPPPDRLHPPHVKAANAQPGSPPLAPPHAPSPTFQTPISSVCKAGYGWPLPPVTGAPPPATPLTCELCPAGYISGPNATALVKPSKKKKRVKKTNAVGRKLLGKGKKGGEGAKNGQICLKCPSGNSTDDRIACT